MGTKRDNSNKDKDIFQVERRRVPGAKLNHGSDLKVSTQWHDFGPPGFRHKAEAYMQKYISQGGPFDLPQPR